MSHDFLTRPYGCLIDALAIEYPANRRKEVAYYAANALRRGRFQGLTRSPTAWERKIWTEEEFDDVVQIVETSVRMCLDRPEPQLKASRSLFMPSSRSPGESDKFIPWRPFCDREPVAEAEGVYVFASFDDVPQQIVDPTSKEVILRLELIPRSRADIPASTVHAGVPGSVVGMSRIPPIDIDLKTGSK